MPDAATRELTGWSDDVGELHGWPARSGLTTEQLKHASLIYLPTSRSSPTAAGPTVR